jgi:DNA-binding NarL/FixJ family response regulator
VVVAEWKPLSPSFSRPIALSTDIQTPSQVSVLLVDDESPIRDGLRTLLGFYNTSSTIRFTVVGEAVTKDQAIALAHQQNPSLILLDLELSRGLEDGIQTLTELREFYNGKILILSACQNEQIIFRAMQAGASGYLFKDKLATQLCTAITTVLSNQVYLESELVTQFFRAFQIHSQRSRQSLQTSSLSERELEVLQLLVQGDPNAAIAERLYITVATVKAHLTSIFEKLSVKSRSQAIVAALRSGLV